MPDSLMPEAGSGVVTGTVAVSNAFSLEATQIEMSFFDLSTAGVTRRTFTGVTAKTAALTAGKYVICADQDCHVRTGPQASAAATLDDFFLPAGVPMGAIIDATNTAFAVIQDTTAGNLNMVRIGA